MEQPLLERRKHQSRPHDFLASATGTRNNRVAKRCAARLADAASAFVEFEGRISGTASTESMAQSSGFCLISTPARPVAAFLTIAASLGQCAKSMARPLAMETRGEVPGALIEAKLTLDRILSNYHGQ